MAARLDGGRLEAGGGRFVIARAGAGDRQLEGFDDLRADRHMQTNLADVYAAGDCVATYHRLLDSDTYLPLGTTAHEQGRIAGENAVGGDRNFEGSLDSQRATRLPRPRRAAYRGRPASGRTRSLLAPPACRQRD